MIRRRGRHESYLDPQPALKPLIRTGNGETSMRDSAIRTWLMDAAKAKKQRAA